MVSNNVTENFTAGTFDSDVTVSLSLMADDLYEVRNKENLEAEYKISLQLVREVFGFAKLFSEFWPGKLSNQYHMYLSLGIFVG
jgi:hypothetical protein